MSGPYRTPATDTAIPPPGEHTNIMKKTVYLTVEVEVQISTARPNILGMIGPTFFSRKKVRLLHGDREIVSCSGQREAMAAAVGKAIENHLVGEYFEYLVKTQ